MQFYLRVVWSSTEKLQQNGAATRDVGLICEQMHNRIKVCVCVSVCHPPLIKVTWDSALTASQAQRCRFAHNSLASRAHYLNDVIPHASVSTCSKMDQLHHPLRHSNVSPGCFPAARAHRLATVTAATVKLDFSLPALLTTCVSLLIQLFSSFLHLVMC